MARFPVGLVDVFAEAPLSGNPLAVVEGGEDLDEDTLRKIAREFNQAETTFILPSARADWRLRSFTAAGAEVFGAGHNALGAWLWLGLKRRLGDLAAPREFHQEIGGDVLPITMERRGPRVFGRMRQSEMQLGDRIADSKTLAAALAISPDDILSDPPPRAVSTGAAHLMVRVAGPAAVDKCAPDARALLAALKAADAEGCYVYAFDPTRREAAYARFFNPTVGLWEDAATGTAAGPLAAYLAHAGYLPAHGHLKVLQGARMGRPSLIKVALTPTPELSGSGLIVLEGVLEI